MLSFISIGLNDEKDMSLKALDVARDSDILFAEFYTTKTSTTKEKLEKLIGKPIRILSREEVEEKYQEIILNEAKTKKVGFLVGGDCFVATTHTALKLEAMKQGIDIKVIHGSSIISAIAETGLHIYKFGPPITIPFPEKTKGKLPESVYEIIKMNRARGLHTLCMLDVNADENNYMTAKDAIKIILAIENERKEGVIDEDTDTVVFARAGNDNPLIHFCKASELLEKDFGKPPMVLIIPGILHFTEKEFLSPE